MKKNMIEKLEKLIGKNCSLTLKIGDSYTGFIQKIEFDSITTELRIIFEIEAKKGLIIPISAIKSISEVDPSCV